MHIDRHLEVAPVSSARATGLTERLLSAIGLGGTPRGTARLDDAAVLALHAEGRLPDRWTMVVREAGVITLGTEELVLERRAPTVGDAVALISGGRVAFRRLLAIAPGTPPLLTLRADVAPFGDQFEGEALAVVRRRWIDDVAALDPERFCAGNWRAAEASASALSVRRRLRQPRRANLHAAVLAPSDWPRVRAFWFASCGRELPVAAHENQLVVALFDGLTLVGVNIQLVTGDTSYSAFTLVARDYRGAGGGRLMIERAVALARERDLASIYVHINARNLPSIAAYRRAGFSPVRWWSDAGDPLAAAERQWKVFELRLR